MRAIKMLSEMIEEEIGDAEKYAKAAAQHKDTDSGMARLFYDLAGEELHHMELLHEETARKISKYRKEKGEPPAEMMAVYEYLHARQLERVKEVRTWLELYQG